MLVEYPLVGTRFAGPCLVRSGARLCPAVDVVRRRAPLEQAVRFVSAFCSSRDEMSHAHGLFTRRMSRDALNMAPWHRNEPWPWMVKRSKISSMSSAVRMLTSALARRSGMGPINSACLSFLYG